MLRSFIIISLSAALVAGLGLEEKLASFCKLSGGTPGTGVECTGQPATQEECEALFGGSYNRWCKDTTCYTPPTSFPPQCFVHGTTIDEEEQKWLDQVFDVVLFFALISPEPAAQPNPEHAPGLDAARRRRRMKRMRRNWTQINSSIYPYVKYTFFSFILQYF